MNMLARLPLTVSPDETVRVETSTALVFLYCAADPGGGWCAIEGDADRVLAIVTMTLGGVAHAQLH